MFNPTQEQVTLDNHLKAGQNIITEAGAGAAKSTSIRYLAQQNPDKNFLVLCFNKANATEGDEHPDKPANMYHSTIHSIAYRKVVDKSYRAKLSPFFNYRDIGLNKFNDFTCVTTAAYKEEADTLKYKLCKVVINAVTAYCRSDSKSILDFSKAAISSWAMEIPDSDSDSFDKFPDLTLEDIHDLATITKAYWDNIIDADTKTRMTHDVYLKLFYLRQYKITSIWDKDAKVEVPLHVLALDEAQDSNPITVAIFKDSTAAQKIVVGDAMQQLYRWRGAGDAMNQFPSFTKAQLTESFRFTPEIAAKANRVLGLANSDMRVIGSGTDMEDTSEALLCRTNAQVLRAIIALHETGQRIYTTVDLKDLFNKLYHINSVWFGDSPKFPNRALSDIKTKADLLAALKVSDELARLESLSRVLSELGGSLSKGINLLKDSIVLDPSEATLTISTLHKSKGLEWGKVTLDPALIPIEYDESGNPIDMDGDVAKWLNEHDNLCLLYVGITRAKHTINLPSYLQTIIA